MRLTLEDHMPWRPLATLRVTTMSQSDVESVGKLGLVFCKTACHMRDTSERSTEDYVVGTEQHCKIHIGLHLYPTSSSRSAYGYVLAHK